MTTKKKIKYPYLPKGREILHVSSDNVFILAAKKAAEHKGCAKQTTGAVIVKNGKIVAVGSNAGVHINVCPRVLRGSKTGTDYHFCKEVCKQEGHAEQTACGNAKSKNIDVKGADLYLWGHWWCCEPCWNAMIEVGINNVYLEEGAEKKFNISSNIGKIYISGALTISDKKHDLKKIYEDIAATCSAFCSNIYVPHLGGTDPISDPEVSPSIVWKKDHREVASSDLIIAYVGEPSLGVGAELELARIASSDIILWWFEGQKVSRMARGNPNVRHMIEAKNSNNLIEQLKKILSK
ncbi:MAG: deaminase [Patescibacteria group bacterium]|nr:deaminase [Patescibacteria group bacterium]